MVRIALLAIGILLLIFQLSAYSISQHWQFICFFSGIMILGIPHGAADLLVASRNAMNRKRLFSIPLFFFNYLGRLILFALSFYYFPLAANVLFIIMAAYHFGETDLHQFKTHTLNGRLFVTSYGLLILAVILLVHFEEVIPLFLQFESGIKYRWLLDKIDINRYRLLSFSGLLFFVSAFQYFVYNNGSAQPNGRFLIHLSILLFVLFKLPMIVGFTFYFVCWHSILSLRKIISYLYADKLLPVNKIIMQIIIYSLIAMAGISITAFAGTKLMNSDMMIVYVFIGLAVLTAPHMQVMQEMYQHIRAREK